MIYFKYILELYFSYIKLALISRGLTVLRALATAGIGSMAYSFLNDDKNYPQRHLTPASKQLT